MDLKRQKEIAEEKIKEINKKLKQKKNLKTKGKTKFYHFNQNNSGGHFDEDENICKDVFIEAHNKEEANLRADNVGIYFNGCEQGIDCSCCGDRWSEIWNEEDGKGIPMLYNHSEMRKVEDCYEDTFSDKAIIHFLDGTKRVVVFKRKDDGHKHKWKQQYNIGKECTICGIWESELNKVQKR